jgi:hypothetical protein
MMAQDPIANYVVKKAMETAPEGEQKIALLEVLGHHRNELVSFEISWKCFHPQTLEIYVNGLYFAMIYPLDSSNRPSQNILFGIIPNKGVGAETGLITNFFSSR